MSLSIAMALVALALSAAGADHHRARRHALVGAALPLPLLSLVRPPAAIAMLLLGLASVLAGSGPARHARQRVRARRREIERALPDALDLLAGVIEAGAPLGEALTGVARHLDDPVGEELATCAVRLGSPGGSRRDALVGLARAGSPDLARIGYSLATADELGAPIADLLREQAALQRELDRLRIRERAASASPKIALVVSLVLVPSGLLVILGSQALSLLAGVS